MASMSTVPFERGLKQMFGEQGRFDMRMTPDNFPMDANAAQCPAADSSVANNQYTLLAHGVSTMHVPDPGSSFGSPSHPPLFTFP